jgi:transposase-like protein
MTRKSPYVLELTAEQRRELEARARRYTLPYRDVVRAKIVLMAAEGLGNEEIAARPGTNRVIVSRWRKRFFEQGLAGLGEHPRGGRPPVFPLRWSSPSSRSPASCRAASAFPSAACTCPACGRVVIERGIVAEVSGKTIWRWLSEDAIKPWRHRCWIFPRDPAFEAKARAGSLTSAPGNGTESRSGTTTSSSPPTRRPPSRPASAAITAFLPRHGGRCGSSTSTREPARSSTWPPGTSIAPRSSAAASPRRASSPSDGSPGR